MDWVCVDSERPFNPERPNGGVAVKRTLNAVAAAVLIWGGVAKALPITFSADASGNLVIDGSGSGTFPMAGYRRAFSSSQELAQFCINNLNATAVYDSAGTLIGVKGTLISTNYATYYNSSGQLVRVDDPILSFLGGTTGTIVVGDQLWNLWTSDPAAAITAITPPPAEDVWVGAPPTSSASASLALDVATRPNARGSAPIPYLLDGDTCTGSPPVCYVNGQRGHKECDLDTLKWTGCVVDGPPPTVSVTVFAPTTFSAPLGTFATFRGSVYDPYGRDNSGTWSAPAGSGALVQWRSDTFYTDVHFYPYQTYPTTLTFRSNIDPSQSATATVTVPFGSPLPDTGTYPDQADDCVSGDSGTKACESGQTYHHNWWFYNDRGARTDYLVCSWIGCGINDRPGPGVVLTLFTNFYFHQSGTGLLQPVPATPRREYNVGHVDVKAWRLFVGGGGEVPGVDDIAGVCAVHGSSGNLASRTGQDAYINGCR